MTAYRNILTALFRRRRYTIVCLMIAAVCFLTRCIDDNVKPVSVRQFNAAPSAFSQFAGAEACAGCHKDIYEKHLSTAHYLTSKPATAAFLKGSFSPDSNSYRFNPSVQVKMEKRKDSFYQVAYIDGIEKRAERFDIVIGSSLKGQSFLHWNRDELTQLPITWFTPTHQWSNSPGYAQQLLFNRPISARCLECHTTYAYKISPENKDPELFEPAHMVFGVDCEKCHGPAAKHVEFHKSNPSEKTARFVVNPAHLTRQQNLDLCALCHGGKIAKTKPSFSFNVGQKLTDFFKIDTVGRNVNSIDVHGNQFGLMAASACFKNSDMTCNSCHGAHEKEKGNLQLYSTRCMNCHKAGHEKVCKLTPSAGAVISKNCIDCHMPKQPSRSIAVVLEGNTTPTPVLMRTHYIKAYPDEAKKVLDYIKNRSNKKG